MASTIKVDNVQNQPGTNIINKCGTTITVGAACNSVAVTGNIVKSNALQASDGGNIVNQCGTTVTLGASGDTIALASGASQTGFGRTGTVDWETSIQTGTVTAATGKGYFVNTTSGGITVNLPVAAVGSIVAVSDYASTSGTNNITITPNGSEKINGVNASYYISTAGLAVTLVYADVTKGWKSVTGSDQDSTGVVPAYVAATGGSPCAGTTCGDYKIHAFTGPGTLCVTNAGNVAGSNVIDYLIVGGGGGAGGSNNPGSAGGGGGGGGGGFRETKQPGAPWTASPLALAGGGLALGTGATSVAVGAGGGSGGSGGATTSGSLSSVSATQSAGGGYGGVNNLSADGGDGGSGGGTSFQARLEPDRGLGNTPPVSPPQGTPGGLGGPNSGGGGGGATVAGSDYAAPETGGAGGTMASTGISGASVEYAGGGGGGGGPGTPSIGGGASGGGGAGAGAGGPGTSGNAGTVNTGGGGGAGAAQGHGQNGAAGGSGIVYIRYKFQ